MSSLLLYLPSHNQGVYKPSGFDALAGLQNCKCHGCANSFNRWLESVAHSLSKSQQCLAVKSVKGPLIETLSQTHDQACANDIGSEIDGNSVYVYNFCLWLKPAPFVRRSQLPFPTMLGQVGRSFLSGISHSCHFIRNPGSPIEEMHQKDTSPYISNLIPKSSDGFGPICLTTDQVLRSCSYCFLPA